MSCRNDLAGGLGTGLLQPGGEKALEQPPGNLPVCPGGHQGNSHDLPTGTQHKLKEEVQDGDLKKPDRPCFHHDNCEAKEVLSTEEVPPPSLGVSRP